MRANRRLTHPHTPSPCLTPVYCLTGLDLPNKKDVGVGVKDGNKYYAMTESFSVDNLRAFTEAVLKGEVRLGLGLGLGLGPPPTHTHAHTHTHTNPHTPTHTHTQPRP